MKMKRIYALIYFFLIFSIYQSHGQYLKMATFATGGGTVSREGNYMAQVIGQSSIISGTAVNDGMIFRQGFKQPFGLLKENKIYKEESPWSFEAFPNPFVNRVTLRFDRPTIDPVSLQVYDLQGKVLWQGDYPAQMEEIILENFQNITTGKYILYVFQKGKSISKSLIKQIN